MQTQTVHESVHDEGGSGHVAGVFHERDACIEDEDVGQEYDDAAHASYDAVGHEVFDPAVGQIFA